MVDRLEFGFEWQSYLDDTDNSLINVQPEIEEFQKVIAKWAFKPFITFNTPETNVKKYHFVKDTDSDYFDSADFSIWSGHSSKSGFTLMNGDKITHKECEFGNTDIEVVVFHSCNFLEDENVLKNMMNSGAHMICGFKTEVYDEKNNLPLFGTYLQNGLSIIDAWQQAAIKSQRKKKGITTRCYYLNGTRNQKYYSSDINKPIEVKMNSNKNSIFLKFDCNIDKVKNSQGSVLK
jgi:hypothetical protein